MLRAIALLSTCLLLALLAAGGSRLQGQEPELHFFETPSWAKQVHHPAMGRDCWGTPMIETVAFSDSGNWLDWGGVGRAWYLNDQRIEFTGMEGTFGVDGAVRGEAAHFCGDTLGLIYGELFVNQAFERNVLRDSPQRESFAHNFDQDTVEISQLSFVVARNEVEFELGRFVTPFGRFYGQSYHNRFVDLPFLRNEVIFLRETGAQLRWNPSIFRSTLAITNGGWQMDSNSSKAMIARVGVDLERWTAGVSVKTQDGLGSEGQKEFNEHAGIDAMFRATSEILIFGEYVVDHHGLRRAGVGLDDITWGRSLYNRQLNKAHHVPIDGRGWYLQILGEHERFDWGLGYGCYQPEEIGDANHDTPVRRGTGQIAWHLGPSADFFTSIVLENRVEGARHEPRSNGFTLLSGLMFSF